MKTKFNNRELAHQWANCDNSFRGTGSSMFAENGEIYSYGYHFLIAKKVQTKYGVVVIFNSRSYSNSTSKHQSYVSGASFHLPRFCIPGAALLKGKEAKDFFKNIIEGCITQSVKAKKYTDWYLKCAEDKRLEALKYFDTFKIKTVDKFFTTPIAGFDLAKYEQLVKDEKLARKRAVKKEIAAKKKEIKEWRCGERRNISLSRNIAPILRYNKDENRIETSMGANVNADVARRLWKLYSEGKSVKGERMGNYTIIKFNGMLKAGCHQIEKQEVVNLMTAI